jgi:hypothetical protein
MINRRIPSDFIHRKTQTFGKTISFQG